MSQDSAPLTPLAIIDRAIERGIDPNALEKLMDLQSRWLAQIAAKEFATALTEFQKECPQIERTRHTKEGGKINFAYASLDDVMHVAGPLMAKQNIVATFTTEPGQGVLKVICRIRVGTHAEESALVIPIPTGTVNATQLMAQALSYGKRYTLCAALGIVCTDEDIDANFSDPVIDENQVGTINKLMEQCTKAGKKIDPDKFLAYAFGVDVADLDKDKHRLDMLGQKRWTLAINMLTNKLDKKGAAS